MKTMLSPFVTKVTLEVIYDIVDERTKSLKEDIKELKEEVKEIKTDLRHVQNQMNHISDLLLKLLEKEFKK
jgi:prefoldin subunit 5